MFEPEELMARIVDLEAQLKVSEMAHPAAEQLIACLEGEIAKRDARIVELNGALKYVSDEFDCQRAELAAIKAQEPVAYIPVDRETGEEWHPVLKKGSGNICDYKPLYAAPVSEAKAQGVVMPDPYGWVAAGIFYTDRESAICAAGKTPCIEVYSRSQINALENRSLLRQEVAEELARQLSASCAEVRNLRSLNAAPVQQVSVPDENEEAAAFEAEFKGYKAFVRDTRASEAAGKYIRQRSHMFKVWMHFRAMLAAAQAAPAADAWIPVKERLPDGDVLCSTKRGVTIAMVCDCGVWLDRQARTVEPTHWMPLPAVHRAAANAPGDDQ